MFVCWLEVFFSIFDSGCVHMFFTFFMVQFYLRWKINPLIDGLNLQKWNIMWVKIFHKSHISLKFPMISHHYTTILGRWNLHKSFISPHSCQWRPQRKDADFSAQPGSKVRWCFPQFQVSNPSASSFFWGIAIVGYPLVIVYIANWKITVSKFGKSTNSMGLGFNS